MTKNSVLVRNGVIKATVIIAVFSVLAKILGLARDAVFSNQFGTSVVIDAYFAAFRIPDFVFNLLILGTFSVAFIPVFSEYMVKDSKESNKLASSIINFTLILILGLSLLAFVFIDPLVSLIAPGFTGEARELTEKFTRIFLLSPIFLTLSSIVSSILNSYKRFALVSIAPVLYNLSIIFGVLVLYPKYGTTGLGLSVVLGAVLHFAIQVPQLFKLGFKYYFKIDYRQPGFIQFWKLYWPRVFSMGTSQVTFLVATVFGSFLSTGALATFYYANNLQGVFLSIFAVSAALAVFPLMSDLYNTKDEEGFKDVLAKTSIQILFFILPLSAIMLVMRAQIVRLVLGIGQGTSFTFEDTRIVSLTLGLFVISLFAQALIPLFSRAFYARQNTKIPVVIGLITIAVNAVITYFAVNKLGVPGMALAFSISSILNFLMLLVELHHKIKDLHDEYMMISSLKIIIASLLSGAASFVALYIIAPWVNMQTYGGVMIQATGAFLVGGSVYLAVGWLLDLPESKNLIKLTRSMLSKFAKPISNIWNMLDEIT